MSKNIKTLMLDNYLSELEDSSERKIIKGDNLRCEICGREVKINVAGKGPLICCGKPMVFIEGGE
jgi:desulfoferrodoxin-like iron-binding protein